MKARIIHFAAASGFLVVLVLGGLLLIRKSNEAWGWEFPVEGLVLRDGIAATFEPVPKQDRQMLFDLGFPKALRHLDGARVRHLVIYQDCQYFFTTDGRIIVMTPGSDGRTPRLVETKHWEGAPHDFHDYRKELLPTP